jgi:hypothetical protein
MLRVERDRPSLQDRLGSGFGASFFLATIAWVTSTITFGIPSTTRTTCATSTLGARASGVTISIRAGSTVLTGATFVASSTLAIGTLGTISLVILGCKTGCAVGRFHRPGGTEDLGKINPDIGKVCWGVGIVAHGREKIE